MKPGSSNPTWSEAGTVFWALTDHLGTVRDLAQAYGYPAGSGMPSQQTHLVKHREHDAFGNLLSEWNRGDFNEDGSVNAADIDELRDAINAGSTDLMYDLNGDGSVTRTPSTFHDMDELVLIILNTYYGDSNLDGAFDSNDIVHVFGVGEYEDGDNDNSGWEEGDWNGDEDFDSNDFSFAMGEGGYEQPNRGGGAFAVHQTIIGYTGRPLDVETGLQNNLNRWYDARVGRCVSEDPIGFAAGDSNLYRYVGNSPANATDPLGLEREDITIRDAGVGAAAWEITMRGKTAVRLAGEDFFVTGRPQKGMWKPQSGSTSSLLIYRKNDPKRVFRLDYHGLKSTSDRPVWHYNKTSGFGKIKGLRPADHKVTGGAAALGRTITIFRRAGRALFVTGAVMDGVDIYHAENRPREITKKIGGLAGAAAGGRAGAAFGIKAGVGFVAFVGNAGPQAAAPEEIVTVPAGAVVGGILGGIGGSIIGGVSGSEITETVFEWVLTQTDKEEWVVLCEIK